MSGRDQELLELPPLTYRAFGFNLPVAGGGYFRLFPLGIMRAGLGQAMRSEQPSVAIEISGPDTQTTLVLAADPSTKGRYLGRNMISGPVDLYGSMIQGVVMLNGRVVPPGKVGTDVRPW